MIAPPAPRAAAGVGLVIPPRIEPKHGNDQDQRWKDHADQFVLGTALTAGEHPYSDGRKGTPSDHITRMCPADKQRCRTIWPEPHRCADQINGRLAEGRTPRALSASRPARSARSQMPVRQAARLLLCPIASAKLVSGQFRLAATPPDASIRSLLATAASHAA